MKPILTAFVATFISYVSLVSADEAKPPEASGELAVYVGPGFVPDSGINNLFRERLSRLDFLFYQKGAIPIKDFAKSIFTVDIPKSVTLRSVALMSGWKKPGGKFYDLPAEPITRDGQDYLRYTLPLPGYTAMAKAEATKGGSFGGISYNTDRLFLRAGPESPENFTVYWKVDGKSPAEGKFPVRLFPSPDAEASKPKRIFLVGSSVRTTPAYWDLEETRETAALLRDIGISYVPAENRALLLEKGDPDVWSEAGFKFFGTEMDLMVFNKEDRSSLPEKEDYLVGLDGERSKGSHPDKFHGRLYCPRSTNTPGRTGFERMKAKTLKAIDGGASWVDFDMEPHIWTQCFCPDCLKDFSEFSKIPLKKITELKPFKLIMTYPETWYRFRSSQTATFYRNLRMVLKADHPEVKISANSFLVNIEKRLDDIGQGMTSFAEDPRLLDDSVDMHTVDALTGSVMDPMVIDVYRQGTTKPIVGTAGCSYCVYYTHAVIVGRRIQAEERNLPLGYDKRGDFQRLGVLHTAASGASFVRVSVLEYDETIDADVALKTADAAAILSKVEDDYLDGKRNDDAIEVIDLSATPSPFASDPSIIAGGIWKHFYDIVGAVQYRVHQRNGQTLVSLFNWDPDQDKQWLVRFKEKPATEGSVNEVVSDTQYRLEKDRSKWSPEELKKGILVTVPSAGFTILRIGESEDAKKSILIPAAERKEYLAKAASRQPANQYAWQSKEKIDLREEARKGVIRGSSHLLPGTLPDSLVEKK